MISPHRRPLPTFIFGAWAILLTAQVGFGLWGLPAFTAVHVESRPSRSSFLLSETQPVRVQEFLLSNTTNRILTARIESPSCGCLRFLKDGLTIEKSEAWSVPPGTTISLGLVIPLRKAIGSYLMSFELVIQESSGGVVYHERLETRTEVVPDVVCIPPALHFTADSPMATFRLEHITLDAPSVDPDLSVDGSFILESMTTVGAPQYLGNGLVKTTRHGAVRHDGGPTRGHMRLHFSSSVEESIPLLLAAERSQ